MVSLLLTYRPTRLSAAGCLYLPTKSWPITDLVDRVRNDSLLIVCITRLVFCRAHPTAFFLAINKMTYFVFAEHQLYECSIQRLLVFKPHAE
jgi:hypothetical protein